MRSKLATGTVAMTAPAAILLLSLSLMIACSTAGSVMAGGSRPLEAAGVEDVLGRQGFREIRVLSRRGDLWLADAQAPRGRKMRAVVDATTGEIAGLRPLDGGPPDLPPVR
jgi:hypothetical protein